MFWMEQMQQLWPIGDTMVVATLVYIDWAWLTSPLLIWLLSVALRVATAWQTRTRKISLWRNNLVNAVYLFGEEQNANALASPRTSTAKEDRPRKEDYVQLHVAIHNTYSA